MAKKKKTNTHEKREQIVLENLEIQETEFSEQPDSGSRIGGHRGENEYGVTGELVRDSSHSAFREMNAPKTSLKIESVDEPLPFGELKAGFPGVSEWSAQRAGLEALEDPEEQEWAADWQYSTILKRG